MVSGRSASGMAVPTGTPVPGSVAYPGAATGTVRTAMETAIEARARKAKRTWPVSARARHVVNVIAAAAASDAPKASAAVVGAAYFAPAASVMRPAPTRLAATK